MEVCREEGWNLDRKLRSEESDINSEKVIAGRNHRMGKNWELERGKKSYSGNNDFEQYRVEIRAWEGQLECKTMRPEEDIWARFRRQSHIQANT